MAAKINKAALLKQFVNIKNMKQNNIIYKVISILFISIIILVEIMVCFFSYIDFDK
jgi:hypothetical protein